MWIFEYWQHFYRLLFYDIGFVDGFAPNKKQYRSINDDTVNLYIETPSFIFGAKPLSEPMLECR